MKGSGALSAARAMLATVLLVTGLGAGCLCTDPPKSAVERCIDSCGTNQYLCQKQCGSDDPCARACVEAYKQCIGVCDKAR